MSQGVWGRLKQLRARGELDRLQDATADALARGDATAAASTARRTVEVLTAVDPRHPDLPVARYALAVALLAGDDPAAAEHEASQALAELPTPAPADLPRRVILEVLASAAEKRGDDVATLARLRDLVADAEASPHGDERDRRLATASTRLGLALARGGRGEEGWPQLARAVALRRQRLGRDDLLLAEALHNAATHRLAGSPPDEAAARFEEAIRIARAAGEAGRVLEEAALHNLGVVREEQGRDDEAQRAWEQALERRQARLGPDHHSLRATIVRLARLRERTGSILHASVLYERALRLARAELGDDHEVVRALAAWRRDVVGADEPS